MLQFGQTTLAHKAQLDRLFAASAYQDSDYCFGTLYMWQDFYRLETAVEDGLVFMRRKDRAGVSYLFPAGSGDQAAGVEAILSHAQRAGEKFRLMDVHAQDKILLERAFPGRFVFSPDRSGADYIYASTDLAALPGKKYHSKRNHIAKFEKTFQYDFLPIGPEQYETCLEVNRAWCANFGCEDSLLGEKCAIRKAFSAFEQLELSGGLLLAEGRGAAYTFGEALSADTFVVHVEKGLPDFPGCYNVINRDFVKQFLSQYRYIDREEDMGDEGLRRAKLSYKPILVTEKWFACLAL